MDAQIEKYFPIAFPIALWLGVTVMLSALSGWFNLATAYPDRDEQPLLRLKHLSGSMGLGVHMNNILKLSACPSGLRVGIMRIFGPFSRDFLVPWTEVHVTRQARWYGDQAMLEFGFPRLGRLTIPAYVANRLARAAERRWPEPGPFPFETPGQTFRAVLTLWAIGTGFAATFFTITPRLMGAPSSNFPPVAVTVLFPAVAFGIATMVEYFRRRSIAA